MFYFLFVLGEVFGGFGFMELGVGLDALGMCMRVVK